MLVVAAGSAYYFLIYWPAHRTPRDFAYVLSDTLEVVDTPAEVRMAVGLLRRGDRLDIAERTPHWARIRTAAGLTGWVELKSLLDSETYEAGQHLLGELSALPPQAEGHTDGVVNLRLEPSRDAPQLSQLDEDQKLEVFGRRLVDRPAPAEESTKLRDAWYLVRVDSRAGWVLGKFVTLDIPASLSRYAQGTNVVAWVVIRTIEDGGQQVPEYLVADRLGAQDVDFTHLRVFTWWAKHHEYVTAFVESNLKGYFPIRVASQGGVPYFRLRLKDEDGEEYQKVYRMFDTITRVVGTVPGWESDAMPTSPEVHRRGHPKRRPE